MNRPLQLRTFQIGTPRQPGEGLRIAATRRPPRGIRRADWQRKGCFDIWFPVVAPSADLLREGNGWCTGFRAYAKEMQRAEPRQAIELLAALAAQTPISIGCYCPDESHCHRSRLRELIERAANDLLADETTLAIPIAESDSSNTTLKLGF